MKTLKVGDRVTYRGSWGQGAPKEATIESIEYCQNAGDKYGIATDEVYVDDVERSVFDLSDGHWCYGFQIVL